MARSKLYHRVPAFDSSVQPTKLLISLCPQLIGFLALLLLVLTVLDTSQLYAQASVAGDKIEQKVLTDIRQNRRATFFVILRDQADLSQAARIRDWKGKGDAVVTALRQHALKTQAPLLTVLAKSDVVITPFWIVNTIKVTTGDEQLIHLLAGLPQVASITAEHVWQIPEPKPAADEPSIQSVEWGVSRVHAPEVWSQFNAQGQGVVIASIDTGVQFNHPALVNQYRGTRSDGTFDHNYN